MEVITQADVSFIILKNVRNTPGVGAEITNLLYRAGMNIEYFQATAPPEDEYADIMIMLKTEDIGKARRSIERMKYTTRAKRISVVSGLLGITLRGTGFRDIPGLLNRAFSVCAKQKVNVFMAYTTVTSINLYIDTKEFAPTVIEVLQKEFEELG